MSLFKHLTNYQVEDLKNKKENKYSQNLQYKGFTCEEIDTFMNTMYEAHELAMKKFMQRNSDSDGDILIDSMLAIRQMEQIKREIMLQQLG